MSASNSLYFGSYNRKCTYFGYTNFDFLMYCYNSLIQCHIFARGEKIRSNLDAKLHKLCLRGQGQSVESEKYSCQNGHNSSFERFTM